MTYNYRIEPLDNHPQKRDFSCGVEVLDNYLIQRAGQEARKHVAATFLLLEETTDIIAGYYTLSSIGIDAGKLPERIVKKLPRYPQLPATLLGRLAIDRHYQGKKLGELLLIDALKRSFKLSKEIASLAVIVDAIDQQAEQFYKRYGFINFPQQESKLFLPMTTIEKLNK